MYEIAEDGITLRLRVKLIDWLAGNQWHPQQLIDWLQGYDLPPIGHDDEPYLWLLRGLPLADARYAAEVKLATRVGIILEDRPDEKRPGTRPDQVLYNLFMLAAGLSCPDQLADPLYEVFKRGVLKGEWLGVDLRYALQVALALNQLDARLLPEWEATLERRERSFLPGNEYNGFEGVRLMPPSQVERGEPALDAIGRALKAMATHLEEDEDRRSEFRSLINKVIETYPGRPTWNTDILHQANKNQWPDWAWPDWAMQSLPGMQHIPDEYRDRFRDTLRRSPYLSRRAAVGILAHEVANLRKNPENDERIRNAFEKAYQDSLKSLAVGPSGRG